MFFLQSPSDCHTLATHQPGHHTITSPEAVLWMLESPVAGLVRRVMISWATAELWTPRKSPASQLFLPSFLYSTSALQWLSSSHCSCASVSPIRTEDLSLSWGSVTLFWSLPAICLPIHPSTAAAELGLCWNKSVPQEPWLFHDFDPLSIYTQSPPLLSLLPEATDNYLNQILVHCIDWAHLITFPRTSLASLVPASLFSLADADDDNSNEWELRA